jgi:predicted amino acid-binding ACT domain protein
MDAKDHGRRWFVMSAIGGDRPGIVAACRSFFANDSYDMHSGHLMASAD